MTASTDEQPGAGPLKRLTDFLARFNFLLLVLAGLMGAGLLFYSQSWDRGGPTITLTFLTSLVFSELVSSLKGPTSRRIEGWLNRLNVPLFILCGCMLVYKVIGILTMPES
jgi:hypothetical protein